MANALQEVMDKLQELGTEQTKNTFMRHGAREPLFGVKVGDLKKLVKAVRKDQQLARDLFDTGNSDAMYLAGLTVDPASATKEMLRHWARSANWYMLAEYTVAGVAAESPFAVELAREWMASPDEFVACCGWSTYANYISVTPDERLDLEELSRLLRQVERTIHEERNRVRYTMNVFVIVVGTSVRSLHGAAAAVAEAIGNVRVDVGRTACKVPLASDSIRLAEAKGTIGKKKKTCIC
ncbi:DNA alkylation repair protein [Paenibacillus hodogayensis]|uniref:DNA alkylation repair protein n=1 Tax=Paenibacillus hodogayensis TaxID=279208 RepID=A0ABV5W0U0_9BACL